MRAEQLAAPALAAEQVAGVRSRYEQLEDDYFHGLGFSRAEWLLWPRLYRHKEQVWSRFSHYERARAGLAATLARVNQLTRRQAELLSRQLDR